MKKVCLLLLIILLSLAGTARIESRQKKNGINSKREPRVRASKIRVTRSRGEVLENLFNIYDPSFLSIVWPKITNGVHLFVEHECWRDLSVFFKDLADGRAWAYSVVDASGRYQSALFEGNRFWLGSKQQCLQLDSDFKIREVNETIDEFPSGDYLDAVLRREKYFNGDPEEWRSIMQHDEVMQRLVAADKSPPHRLAYVSVQLLLNLTKIVMSESYDITLGVCLPRSCSLEDVASVINFSIMINDNLKSNRTMPRAVKVLSLRQVEAHYNINTDVGAILLICVTILLVIVTVAATLVDLNLVKCNPHNSKSMSFDLQKFNNHSEPDNKNLEEEKNHECNILTRKESNVVDMETLTINNINNSNNINLVTVKKVVKPNALPPSITLDVVSMERMTGSCKRCGKYKKQCNNPRQFDNLPACPRVRSIASLTAEHKRNNKFFKSLFLCFSLNYSWKRIFNTNMANKNLSIVHGLRIIATFWIIYLHVSMIASYVSENDGDVNKHNNSYYMLTTGTLAFDTLIFVSGLFSSHHFYFLKSQYSVEELVSFGGPCGQLLQFVCFVTNRAIRLLPSYAFAIFLTAVVARMTTRTAVLALPEGDETNCYTYWWRNLLYVTTVFPRREQCMQVSWYLSTETQLHVAGALACSASASGRRVVAALATVGVLVATAADVSAAYSEFGSHLAGVYAAYAIYIERPLARVAPYFIGVFAGWLIHRMDGKLHISKTRSWCLWVASLSAVAMSLWVPRVGYAWLASWLHLVWPAALLWPILIFSTQLAEWPRRVLHRPGVAALSRLTYGALLLHGAAARTLLLAPDTALCSRAACLWSYAAGTAVLSTLLALILALLVETPCCALLRRLSDRVA